jgi:hypothetical protein
MATPMLHDILLFVLAPGDKSERERSINACKRYGRVTSMGDARQQAEASRQWRRAIVGFPLQ